MTSYLKNNHLSERAVDLFLILAGILFVVIAIFSLKWYVPHKAANLNYFAFLIDHYGYVPYRDIFDINFPGAFLFHLLIIKVAGHSQLGFRIFDLIWLGLFLTTTYFVMKNFSKRVAIAAAIFTGLIYFAGGPQWSLASDIVLLLPIILAVLIWQTPRIKKELLRNLLIGLLLGLAATIKPAALLVWFAFLPNYGKPVNSETGFSGWQKACWLGLGFLIIPFIICLWLTLNGALTSFWEIFINYIPLYGGINGDFVVETAQGRILYIFDRLYSLYPISILFGPAVLGAYIFIGRNDSSSNTISLFLTLFVLFVLSTILEGKFWQTHWFGAMYFTVLLLSLCLSKGIKNQVFVHMTAILVLVLYLYPVKQHINVALPPQHYLGHEIGSFLKANSTPADRVQIVGSLGLLLNGMYAAKSNPATAYLYSLMFFHNVNNPYIQKIQIDFLNQLQIVMPRFIIQSFVEPVPSGLNTSQSFPALDNFIRNNYMPAKLGQAYTIWVANR